jgi:hypothetical protein
MGFLPKSYMFLLVKYKSNVAKKEWVICTVGGFRDSSNIGGYDRKLCF